MVKWIKNNAPVYKNRIVSGQRPKSSSKVLYHIIFGQRPKSSKKSVVPYYFGPKA